MSDTINPRLAPLSDKRNANGWHWLINERINPNLAHLFWWDWESKSWINQGHHIYTAQDPATDWIYYRPAYHDDRVYVLEAALRLAIERFDDIQRLKVKDVFAMEAARNILHEDNAP